MLDAKFKSATGKGLTEDNLKFLAGKAFRLDRFVAASSVMAGSWTKLVMFLFFMGHVLIHAMSLHLILYAIYLHCCSVYTAC